MSFVGSHDRENTKAFYSGVLGLTLTADDPYALVFQLDGQRKLRISPLKDYKPQTFTVLGWEVPDIAASIKALKAKGVTFQIYEGFGQDELGVWSSPDGGAKVAWFTDPAGNILSLTQF